MAIVGDAVGTRHIAKAFGFTCLFLSAGFLCGPAISGMLYDLVPYSVTWASAFAVLGLGIILQSLVLERSMAEDMTIGKDLDPDEASAGEDEPNGARLEEISPLLLPSTESILYQSITQRNDSTATEDKPTSNVYAMMLHNRRVVTALVADTLFAMTIASFDTTIPLHIQKVFAWKSLQAGLLFLLLQLPSLILVVPAGWLKDGIGMHYPVTVGFLCLAPSLWLLGLPGEGGFEWANRGQAGQIIYICAILAIGVSRTSLLGFGGVEVMRKCIQPDKAFLMPKLTVVYQREQLTSQPYIPRSSARTGYTRAPFPCRI